MSYKTDAEGVAFSGKDCKLQIGASTWATRLSQYHRNDEHLIICTYSLPDLAYVKRVIAKRPHGVLILCNIKFKQRAQEIANEFPICVFCHPRVHAKFVLSGKDTVTIGSANFGDSGWHEASVSIHSLELHTALRHWWLGITLEEDAEHIWHRIRRGQKPKHSGLCYVEAGNG